MTTEHAPQTTAQEDRRRIQRAWELSEALDAARRLQARLELLGDHADDVRAVHELRDRLAAALGGER